MRRLRRPLDEKRNRIGAGLFERLLERKRPPREFAAIRSDARAVERPGDSLAALLQSLRECAEISTRGGPGNQARLLEGAQVPREILGWLRRIGRDDLEIPPLPERNQRIAAAPPGMAPAHGGLHAELLRDPLDPRVEIPRAEQQMIDRVGRRLQG